MTITVDKDGLMKTGDEMKDNSLIGHSVMAGVQMRSKAMKPMLSGMLVAMLLLASGCVTSRVEQTRVAETGIATDEAMVLLGRASYNDRETEASFTACIASEMARGDIPIQLVTQDDFMDQLYPWFEPRVAPVSAEQLGDLFARPGVRERVKSSNIRYLGWVEGDTVVKDKGGSMSCAITTAVGGCLGISYWEEDASYEISIWDLETLTASGKIRADATGTSYLAGLVIPVPILARPGNAACESLANQLKTFIIGS